MIRAGILGATGRMGQELTALIRTEFADQLSLSAQPRRDEPLDPLLNAELVIDFSSPEMMINWAQLALKSSPSQQILPVVVVGSSGWTPEGENVLKQLAKRTPVLPATNFAIGVSVFRRLLQEYSPILKKLGYTPTLLDIHHQHKKDAPSGTALTLLNAIDPQNPRSTQTQCFRAGEVFGNHTVTFYGKDDSIQFAHSALNRTLWARGAIQVGLWLAQKRAIQKTFVGFLNIDDYFNDLS